MGFLKALAKVGLVQLDESESEPIPEWSTPASSAGLDDAALERILQEERRATPVQPPLAEPPRGGTHVSSSPVVDPEPPSMVNPTGTVTWEGRPFESIYDDAKVPPSPFPAEKLLKLLDGLKAMDPITRKVAVTAMDAADDAWTVADAVLDAQRKAHALGQAQEQLQAHVARAEQQIAQELAAQDQYREQATATIHKQIADLETLLEQELGKVAENKARAQHLLQGQRDAFAREAARFQTEVARLMELSTTFGSDPPA